MVGEPAPTTPVGQPSQERPEHESLEERKKRDHDEAHPAAADTLMDEEDDADVDVADMPDDEAMDDNFMEGGDDPEPGDDAMISALVLAGAELKQAQQYALVARGQRDPPTFVEFF